MRRTILALVSSLALVTPAAAQERTGLSRTWNATAGRAAPAWFLCDVLDRPQAVVLGVHPRDGGPTRATFIDKTDRGAARSATFDIGPGDPGAGQIHYPVRDRDGLLGELHEVNPGMVADPPGALTPTFMSVKLGSGGGRCRWEPGMRFLGVTARRSVEVTQGADGRLRYAAFGFDRPSAVVERPPGQSSAPSLVVEGGRETARSAGARFDFEAGGFGYRVEAPNAAGARATLTVLRGGRVVQREAFLAYTSAPAVR